MRLLKKLLSLWIILSLNISVIVPLLVFPVSVSAAVAPIAKWSAEGNANDSAGTNHGTMTNGAAFAPGRVGQAFSFDGVNDYVHVGDLDLPSTFTIDAWIKPDTAGVQLIMAKGNSFPENRSYWFYIGNTGTLSLVVMNESGQMTFYDSVSGAVTGGQWNHVAAAYDGNAGAGQKIKLYVNGLSVGISYVGGDAGGTPVNNSANSIIGGTDLYYTGLIDELEVFNSVLSAAEINAIYQSNFPSIESVNPVDGATGVPANTVITAAFSEDMDASTIDTTSFTVNGVSGSVSYDASSKTAMFIPETPLSYGTTYTASISTSVEDSAGFSMASDYVWSFTTELADTIPDAFAFADQAGVTLGASIESNVITVNGINYSSAVFLDNGEYSVNGGPYSAIPGTVENGDLVTVRQTASDAYSTTTDATLTIGGVTDTFSVTTLADTFAPTTSINVESSSSTNGWHKTIPTISLSSSEEGTISYSWNGTSSFSIYTGAFNGTQGANTLYYFAEDLAGNTSSISSTEINVDTMIPNKPGLVAPVLSTYISPTTGFNLSWSGSDNAGGSNIQQYQLQYRAHTATAWSIFKVNGQEWYGATSANFKGAAGYTYEFRVFSQDNAGHISAASLTKKTVVPLDQSLFKWGGTWLMNYNSKLYKASAKYSKVKNAYATYGFSGAREITLLMTFGSGGGKADIYIGKTKIKTVDTYSATTKVRVAVPVKIYSVPVSGTLKVVNLYLKRAASKGYRVEIDGVAIRKR